MRRTKDSNLAWIGAIPEDWSVLRGKNVVKKLKRPVKETDGVITCFRDGEVTLRSNRREEGFTFSDLEVGYQGIEPGDLVIHGMDGFAGAIGVSDSRGKGTPVLNVLDSKYDKRYLMYYFRTIAKCGYFESVATGIRVRTCDTNWNKISVTPCLVPPLSEQSRIAVFLDERCGKIDEAITKHKALIEKLDEYRKAVITKAVTKGMRGERKMKESGVVWIKEIPSDWTYKPLKAIFTFGKGLSITKANLVEKGFPVISYGQVHAKYNSGVSVCDELIRYVSKEDICEASLVNKNDLIFADTSEDLEGCGNCVYVDTDYPIYGGYHTIVLNSRSKQNNKFIAYLVKTDDWRFQLRRQLTEVKLYSVSQKVLKDTTVILPTPTEQQEIVAYLDEKCAAIDAAKEHHAQLITKLEEYKKSLIYNAVTGKIEC